MSTTLTLPRWYDLHAHFRQGTLPQALLGDHLRMGCAGVLAMPNTQPPVAQVFDTPARAEGVWSIESYRAHLLEAGADRFDTLIIPLYLTASATPAMIASGAESGLLQACKYYPPHGTTNAGHAAPLDHYHKNGVLRAMEAAGVVLCLHGEAHALEGPDYFDRQQNAESVFYGEILPEIAAAYPDLKIVCEHVTTRTAVDFVKQGGKRIAATVTPQHLLYTVGDLLKGLKYHLYCLPLLKFADDRQVLRDAVLDEANTQFFAGTDSAPHTAKTTACGCAAGCYTGGIAPQLYAQAFEEAGADLADAKSARKFEAFLCRNGPEFYGLEIAQARFTLVKKPQRVIPLTAGAQTILPLPLGLQEDQSETTIPWSVEV